MVRRRVLQIDETMNHELLTMNYEQPTFLIFALPKQSKNGIDKEHFRYQGNHWRKNQR